MEGEAKESTGITRGQNAVHVLPLDWAALAACSAPSSSASTSLAASRSCSSSRATRRAPPPLRMRSSARPARATFASLPSSTSPRAARLLKSSPPHVVVGAPAELVALLQSSTLKAESVRAVALAWLDAILGTPEAEPLETLFGELPKEGARVVLAGELTPAYEALIERYARRARREAEPAGDSETALSAEYVAATPAGRASALRRLLDALDLPQAALYARDERTRDDATRVARALGYPGDAVRVVTRRERSEPRGAARAARPSGVSEEMRALAGSSGRKFYAVVQPSQLDSLRSLLGGGSVSPVALSTPPSAHEERTPRCARRCARCSPSGDVRREVLALEPLLDEFDGIEIAAAALRLLEQQRPARPPRSPRSACR